MINGFVVIDKPVGITSHDVVSRVRRILGTRRVGHTGTLDPFATGVLPIAVNDGTKVIPFLDEGRKTYEAQVRLGVTTDTLDMTGAVLSEHDASDVTRERFIEAISQFTGIITQIPPMFSAIKQNGQPLYKLARQGIEVERKTREIEIFSFELLAFCSPFASVRITCSRGTYVRSLADDIGRHLGCGAALQELRRTASGPFALTSVRSLDELEQERAENRLSESVISPLDALSNLPQVELDAVDVREISFGRSPRFSEGDDRARVLRSVSGLVRFSCGGTLVAVAQPSVCNDGTLKIALKRVFLVS